jgi:hypothetical protein
MVTTVLSDNKQGVYRKMEKTQRNETQRITTLRSNKWTAGTVAMLLGASLILAACGGGDATEPGAVSTPIATMEAPAPGADTEAEDTEADTEDESDTSAETEVMTDTDTIVETEVSTDTEVITQTEVTTDIVETDVITETEVMTETDETTESDVITETAEVGGEETTTETTTETEGTDAGAAATPAASEEVTDTETMTETGAAGSAATAGSTADSADAADSAAMMGVTGAQAQQYVRGSTLLDYDFENLNGDVSGDLEDLLIDLNTGRVLFASIEYGGVLDLGDKDIVVPLNAFTVGEEGELVLNIDEASLESYPDVGNDWPDLADPAWDDDVNTYWNDTGIDVGEGYAEASSGVGWASDIIGHNIADLGVGAGSILDILVNLGTGQAPYVIVDYGGGLDTDPYIIPVAAFEVTDWDNEFAYGADFTPDLLESAPRFDMETYPDGTALDPTFGESVESAWNDLGFSNDLNNDGDVD